MTNFEVRLHFVGKPDETGSIAAFVRQMRSERRVHVLSQPLLKTRKWGRKEEFHARPAVSDTSMCCSDA